MPTGRGRSPGRTCSPLLTRCGRRCERGLIAIARLEVAPSDLLPGHRLLLQREDEHELGVFKWRGALPTLGQYRRSGATTVVTASTGNHGAATAWAAAREGMSAVVFVPDGASASKLALLERFGAELVVGGRDLDVAKQAATEQDLRNLRRFSRTSRRLKNESWLGRERGDNLVFQFVDREIAWDHGHVTPGFQVA